LQLSQTFLKINHSATILKLMNDQKDLYFQVSQAQNPTCQSKRSCSRMKNQGRMAHENRTWNICPDSSMRVAGRNPDRTQAAGGKIVVRGFTEAGFTEPGGFHLES